MTKDVPVKKEHSQQVAKMFTDEEVRTIKDAYCRDATEAEFKIFMHLCENMQLNPFRRQIYFSKIGGKMTTITGIDGLRLIAERTGKYMPGRDTVYHYDEKRNLIGATAYVKKYGPDKSWHEIPATAFMSEFGSKNGVWGTKPHVMIAKCAESLALRKAFPGDLSGLYSEDEMDQAKTHSVENKAKETQINAMEPIAEEEIAYIESMLLEIGEDYRKNLLEYYSKKLWIMEDFTTFPKSEMPSLVRAIHKRMEREGEKIEQEQSAG
jgi:phage recombination protein Bet